MNDFTFKGMYRVQSRLQEVYSEMRGDWYPPSGKLLNSEQINTALKGHPFWRGERVVNLRPAKVKFRAGLFAEDPDILYKEQFFTPVDGSATMSTDIVDVLKSVGYWRKRLPYNASIFGKETCDRIAELLPDLAITISNEYYCHEAGHLLGYDVLSKYTDGYFRVSGRAAWPLIFVEEFRADLHSFGFALELLPSRLAIQTFLYNIFLRFGLDAFSIRNNTDSYGAVPYLLFRLLTELNFITLKSENGVKQLAITNLEPEYVMNTMKACAEHAEKELTGVEVSGASPSDIAVNAATYFRLRALDRDRFKSYSEVITPIEGAKRKNHDVR